MPAKAELNVLFRSGQEAVNSIRIIDVIGKTLLQQLDHSVIGENHYILDVATLSSGIYMIEVINGDQVSVQKIMIE